MEAKPKTNELKSSTHILNIIYTLIRQVFLPLEQQSPSLRQTLNKFCSQIQHSQQQVSGIITIELPSPIDEIKDEEAIKDQELILQYENSLVRRIFRGVGSHPPPFRHFHPFEFSSGGRAGKRAATLRAAGAPVVAGRRGPRATVGARGAFSCAGGADGVIN